MDKDPSWKTASFSARREIPRILWKQKVRCLVHKNQINSVHTSSYLFITHFNIIPQSTPKVSKLSCTFKITHKISACIFIPRTCYVSRQSHCLDLITQIIVFVDENKSWSALLCTFLHFPVISSFLGPNLSLRAQFPKIFSQCSCLNVTNLFQNNKQECI